VDDKETTARTGPADTFAAACRAHQAGRLREAEEMYRLVLQADPRHAQAWYLLGAACQAMGRADEAAASLRRALQERPGHADSHNLLGVVLAQQGRFTEAADCFQQALVLNPTLPGAAKNLELAEQQLDRLSGGLASLQRAVRQRPDDAAAHYRLGMALAKQNKLEEAAASLREAARLDPNQADALANLGTALLLRERPDEAAEWYRRALRLRPGWPEVHNNLGVACLKTSRWEEASACFREAALLRPGHTDAYCNLAQALIRLDRIDDALEGLRRALDANPNLADAYCHRGYALALSGRFDAALESLGKALELRPDHADAHFERALVWLVQGDWRRGLAEYEWRWKTGRFPPVPYRLPAWDGSPLAGRSILLHAEQGIGDTIHFVRYAPLVKERGGVTVVVCPDNLLPLLSRCPGIDRLVGSSVPLPSCHVQASLQSLPHLLGTTPDTIPARVPYLLADPALVERWRGELPAGPAFKVGITWAGSPGYRRDHLRSIPLRHFAPVARLEGVRLYSLQKGPGVEQLDSFAKEFPVTDLAAGLTEKAGAFTDTAAALMSLDLVITADTALVHLAGALGVPTFLALSRVADWRWLLDREDTPWYPSVRLFRQGQRGDWDGLFTRIAGAVARLRQEKDAGQPPSSAPAPPAPRRRKRGRGKN
jgi:tetratricopeptide (TPR) repeat protein